MWRALKAELTYSRPWIFGGLGIAAFVVVLLSVLARFFDDGGGPPFFVIAMFPIMAGMIVSFIALSRRREEHRARLLLSGPLTPGQLAAVAVLLPTCFVGLGVLAGIPMIGLAGILAGSVEQSSLREIAGFAGQFWAYAQLGPLAQESAAARRQRRTGAAITGWTVFALAILVLAIAQFFMDSISGYLGVMVAIASTIGVAVALYLGRTDFTR